MKIVMLTDLYDTHLQYQDNLLGKYYVKNGHDVTVIAATFSSAMDYYTHNYDPALPPHELWDAGVKVIKLPYAINILNRLRKFAGVREILERESPGMIFVHDVHLNLADATWYKRHHPSCRLILDCHTDYSNSAKNWLSRFLMYTLIRRPFLRRHARYVDKFYPVVPVSADFLYEVYGIPRSSMELLPLGADSDLARELKRQSPGGAIRKTLGIPDDAIVVFTGGKFTPLKKTHLLLEACQRPGARHVHVLLVGDVQHGFNDYKLQLLDISAGDPRFHFIGWQSGTNVYRYMDAADLAVFPASQSVLWQQAISMGLPLVVGAATHVGDQDPSYLNLYGNLFILPYDDIRADVIERTIVRMTLDRVELTRLKAAALRTADELLDYDVIVQKTLR